MTRLVLVAGTTETASIEGISAAGTEPETMGHTPSADAEILTYGDVVRAPTVPTSPRGTPTPAVVTRAIREVVGFEVTVVDGGLTEPTAAGTVTVGATAGRDIREEEPVPTAPGAMSAARQFGRAIPDDEVLIGETIPGGTTTALGVLTALGEPTTVSSSLPENPIERKREIVTGGLEASGLEPGDCAGQPRRALRRMGDPVLAVATGFARGAIESGTAVTLAGGTQLLTVAKLLAHAGVESIPPVATTSFVAEDDSTDLAELAGQNVEVTVTDPGFGVGSHPATEGYLAGEAKEGVGMGGGLVLADRLGQLDRVREHVGVVYDRLLDAPRGEPA